MLSRHLILIGLSQVLALTGTTIVVFTGPILGADLAPVQTLATLPIALMVIGVAAFTIPASMIMRRYGRRLGFMASAGLALVAALGSIYAIWQSNFALFCGMAFLIGANNAFVQQYRFAAAESVPAERVGRAVSLLLLAGVVGGFLGPEIATRCKDLLPYGEYSGSYAALAIIYVLVLVVMSFLPSMRAQDERFAGVDSPLIRIIMRPRFLVAVLAGSVAYGVMSLIMTATPISMHTLHGHSLQATALVIQSHVIAMFLPSLITGSLITRAGVPQVMGLGILAMFACIALDIAGTQIFNYWTALTLLGVGWNFLFVGSTVMLTESYLPPERFKAQGFNDFVVFGVQALASLGAGALVFRSSWATINLLAVPLLLGVLIAIVLVSRRTQSIKIDRAAIS